jgi:metallo-beta-lactamase class B
MNVTRRLLPFILVAAAACGVASAQVNPSWKRAFPPFHIAGNVYYVGTEDLACYLITTGQGSILINTGLADSVPLMRASIEKLGFKLSDIKILLTMQAHYDHVAAMAEIQKATGAKMYATAGDKAALESGGKIDGFDSVASQFTPVRVDRVLKDGDRVRLGGTELKVLSHPGHTKGSVSYALTVDEKGTKTPVLIVNLLSVVQPLVNNKSYPNIAEDYAKSFAAQKQLHPGIWLAGHAGQFDMQAKVKAGSFDDPKGYAEAVDGLEKAYLEQLAKQRATQ